MEIEERLIPVYDQSQEVELGWYMANGVRMDETEFTVSVAAENVVRADEILYEQVQAGYLLSYTYLRPVGSWSERYDVYEQLKIIMQMEGKA